MFCAGMVLGPEFALLSCFAYKHKHRGGTKQLYGVRPIRVFPRNDGIASSPLQEELEDVAPRNLSVPRAGQANRRARSPKGKGTPRFSPGAFAAESRPRQTRHRHRQRIGSVQNRLGTWAASAGSSRSKASVTGAAANPTR